MTSAVPDSAGPPRRARLVLGVACAGVLLAAADTYVVVLALTDMMAGVGLGIQALHRATPIVSGFLLGYVAVLPLIGRLSDLVDRRRVMLGCLAIFAVGSVVTALAVELGVLVGGRVLQGVGGGGLVPATLALVADLWPPERRGLPLGVVGGVQELGAVLGPVLGAAILAVTDWRGIFWAAAVAALLLYAALALLRPRAGLPDREPRSRTRLLQAGAGVLAAVLGWLALAAPERLVSDVTLGLAFVPVDGGSARLLTPIGLVAVALAGGLAAYRMWRARRVVRRCDLPGALLVAVSLGTVIVTFATAQPEREVVGPAGLALLPVGAVAAALAWWRVRTARDPLVPPGVLRGPTGWACSVSLGIGAALVAVVVDVPLLARLTLTDSQTEAAFVLVRFLVAVPVGALCGGWLLRRVGHAPLTMVGLLMAAAGLVVMSTWGRGSLVSSWATAVLAWVGLGLGLTLAPVNAAALAEVAPDEHGVASSLVVVARMMGMVVGLALLTSIGLHRYYVAVAALPDPTDTQAMVDTALVQVQTVFLGGAAAAGLAAVVAAGLGWHGPRGSPE